MTRALGTTYSVLSLGFDDGDSESWEIEQERQDSMEEITSDDDNEEDAVDPNIPAPRRRGRPLKRTMTYYFDFGNVPQTPNPHTSPPSNDSMRIQPGLDAIYEDEDQPYLADHEIPDPATFDTTLLRGPAEADYNLRTANNLVEDAANRKPVSSNSPHLKDIETSFEGASWQFLSDIFTPVAVHIFEKALGYWRWEELAEDMQQLTVEDDQQMTFDA